MSDYKDYGYDDNLRPIHFDYLQPGLMAMLSTAQNKTILDIGCGNGYFVNQLKAKGYKAYGIDASEKGIEQASKINPDAFFVMDISSNELPAEIRSIKFDIIISTEVIEHLYDPAAFILFCKSILNSGGEIIISTPYHGYLKNLMLSLFNKWDEHINPLWLGGHIKFWSRKTLSRILADNGFSVMEFKGCGRIPFLWMSMLIKADAN